MRFVCTLPTCQISKTLLWRLQWKSLLLVKFWRFCWLGRIGWSTSRSRMGVQWRGGGLIKSWLVIQVSIVVSQTKLSALGLVSNTIQNHCGRDSIKGCISDLLQNRIVLLQDKMTVKNSVTVAPYSPEMLIKTFRNCCELVPRTTTECSNHSKERGVQTCWIKL